MKFQKTSWAENPYEIVQETTEKKPEWESIREEIQKKSIGSVAEKRYCKKKHLEKSIISNPQEKKPIGNL